uniref:Uncharacterized protein n=1 Tax=Setaria viridis TaxID=4556 RepID=A0A4U6VTT8_SETVI|nr:hypothetical protein SEVIR_2G149700v2 [Setaria viridis]
MSSLRATEAAAAQSEPLPTASGVDGAGAGVASMERRRGHAATARAALTGAAWWRRRPGRRPAAWEPGTVAQAVRGATPRRRGRALTGGAGRPDGRGVVALSARRGDPVRVAQAARPLGHGVGGPARVTEGKKLAVNIDEAVPFGAAVQTLFVGPTYHTNRHLLPPPRFRSWHRSWARHCAAGGACPGRAARESGPAGLEPPPAGSQGPWGSSPGPAAADLAPAGRDNPVPYHRTKYIVIGIHFIREKVVLGQVHVLHIMSSHFGLTDGFMPALYGVFGY